MLPLLMTQWVSIYIWTDTFFLYVVFTAVGMQPPLPAEAVRELVCSCLHRDPVAADLRFSLFVAAAQSYKRDSLLRPFPPRYLTGDIKDFEELVRKRLLKHPPIGCTVIQTLGGSNLPMRDSGVSVFNKKSRVCRGFVFVSITPKMVDNTVFLCWSPGENSSSDIMFSSVVGRCKVVAWC